MAEPTLRPLNRPNSIHLSRRTVGRGNCRNDDRDPAEEFIGLSQYLFDVFGIESFLQDVAFLADYPLSFQET